MAFSGTGAIDDPYVVTTYADLVTKAAESGKYVKIGNDIDIVEEYPNGDAPQLTISCAEVDGDGKTISRFYRISGSGDYCVYVNDPAILKNTNFKNIYTSKYFLYIGTGQSGYYNYATVANCKFAGIVTSAYFGLQNGGNALFKNCSINVEGKNTYLFLFDGKIVNCNIKFTTSRSDIFYYGNSGYAYNSLSGTYLEVKAPNVSSFTNFNYHMTCENNVFDIITDSTVVLNAQPGGSTVSIWNTSHAPNITLYGTAPIKGVDEEHWLDADYLASIGFNIYTED